MKRSWIVVLLTGALLFSVFSPVAGNRTWAAAPASHVTAAQTHSHTAAFDKTRFVLHLAVGAFLVHYIYKKYKQGKLSRRHLFTVAKAAVAALLAYHEIKKAYDIAKASNSATLHVIIAPLTALTGVVNGMASKLKKGDTSAISDANTSMNLLQTTAKSTPYAFGDQQPAGFKGF